VKRVLKENGLFIGTSPAHKHLWSTDDELAHHVRRYSKKELRQKLEKEFKVLQLSYRYFFLFIPSLLIFAVQRIQSKLFGKKKNSLSLTPLFLNELIRRAMRIENNLLIKGFKFPIGTGLFFVCEKQDVRD